MCVRGYRTWPAARRTRRRMRSWRVEPGGSQRRRSLRRKDKSVWRAHIFLEIFEAPVLFTALSSKERLAWSNLEKRSCETLKTVVPLFCCKLAALKSEEGPSRLSKLKRSRCWIGMKFTRIGMNHCNHLSWSKLCWKNIRSHEWLGCRESASSLTPEKNWTLDPESSSPTEFES